MSRVLLPLLALLTVLQLSGLPCLLGETEGADACSSSEGSSGNRDDACPPLCPCCPGAVVTHATLPPLNLAFETCLTWLGSARPGVSALRPEDVIVSDVFHPPRAS